MLLLDLRPLGIKGKLAEEVLDSVNLCTNKNMIPEDDAHPLDPNGIRLGTPAITSRGLNAKDCYRVGVLIGKILNNIEDEKLHLEVKQEILGICSKYPIYPEL
jgi:glycine hydroxymethyltransferase